VIDVLNQKAYWYVYLCKVYFELPSSTGAQMP
jgi:hypothetical protein